MSSPLCGSCAVSFTLFKRKNCCISCRLLYCTACFRKGKSLPQRNIKHCVKCHALSSNPFIPAELMLLSVKELKGILQENNISSSGCREKQDLVDVIINHERPNATTTSTSATAGNTSFRHQTSSTQQQGPSLLSNPDFFGLMQNLTEGIDTSAGNNGAFLHSLLHVMDIDGIGEVHSSTHSTSQNHEVDNMMNDSSEQPSAVWSTKSHNSRPKCVRLENMKNESDIEKLSVKELKAVLDANFVDYKGCLEKEELVQRTIMLWQSKKLDANDSGNIDDITGETNLCKVCMDSAVDCVLLECGHLVTCVDCGKQLKECPMCRQNITRIVRVFKS